MKTHSRPEHSILLGAAAVLIGALIGLSPSDGSARTRSGSDSTLIRVGGEARVVTGAGFSQVTPTLRADGVNYRYYFECILVSTDDGAAYQIVNQAGYELDVSITRQCDTLQNRYMIGSERPLLERRVGGGGRVSFVAGGGAYYVQFAVPNISGQTLPPPSLPRAQPWSLAVSRSTRAEGRRLAAGLNIQLPADGFASRTTPVVARSAGETFRDCPACPQMTVVPPGSFMMGSPDEEEGRSSSEGPRHVVTIGSAFAIGTHEVTFDEYDACVAEQACRAVEDAGWGRGRRPVINVRYLDAQRYVGWLSQKTGQNYFLPSEAEWEYVARAGSDAPWNTGAAIIAADANILGQYGKTVPVGSYPANAFGLFDTHGNVSEWTQDCVDTGYLGAPPDGSVPTGGDCNAKAVLRGGYFGALPAEVRSASRGLVSRQALGIGAGFRVTRAL